MVRAWVTLYRLGATVGRAGRGQAKESGRLKSRLERFSRGFPAWKKANAAQGAEPENISVDSIFLRDRDRLLVARWDDWPHVTSRHLEGYR